MSARLLAAVLVAVAATPPALAADAPRFDLPLNCRPGIDCFVQNYVDADPGSGARDFTCGPLTYDGHRGTDIRVATFAEMRKGIEVRAAAAGRVLNVRDEIADNGWHDDPARPQRRLCGNGVLIAHGGDWTTQYCHMKRGSISVARGQQVAAGQRLGEMGFSGKTAFPHLHFAVREGKTIYDPFTGRSANEGCGGRADDKPLWTAAAAAALAYRASGVLGAGFSDRPPEREEIEAGGLDAAQLPATAPALVFWVEIFGLREGDVETLRLIDAEGQVLAESTSEPAERDRAVQFRYVGKRGRGAAWPAGQYVGEFRLLRVAGSGRTEALRLERRLQIR